MEESSPRPEPAGKSKTDLRRGQFTLGSGTPRKNVPPRGTVGTTRNEEALLFGESTDSKSEQGS